MWYLSFQTGDQNQIESVITDWSTAGKAKDLEKKKGEELFLKTFSTLLVKAQQCVCCLDLIFMCVDNIGRTFAAVNFSSH